MLVLAVPGACGPTPGADTGATTTTGADDSSSSSEDTSTGELPDPPQCPDFRPEATPLAVTIVNSRPEPVYIEVAVLDPELPGYRVARPYDLLDAETAAVVNERGLCHTYRRCSFDLWCPWSFGENPGHDPCDPAQESPPPLRLDPGASYSAAPWDGLAFAPAEVPYECFHALCGVPAPEPTECLLASAYAGELIARVRVGAALDCGGDEPCDCEPDAEEGWCEASGGAVVGAAPVDASLSFPVDALTITIQ